MLSYQQRANFCLSPLAKKLFTLMDEKKTNLALSADVTSADELLHWADLLGPEIALLKTHIDIIHDFSPTLIKKLTALAKQHRFLIFEDRKFADIGHTVKHQYQGGTYQIATWADLVNAHSLPGPGVVAGLAEVVAHQPEQRGLLLLAEMSSKGHLMDADYRQQTLKMAEQFPDFVIGFITQRALSKDPQWIYLTPGVQLQTGSDTLGQQYITPEKALLEQHTDIIIVGRGILAASNPLETAREYRQRGFSAYQKRCE